VRTTARAASIARAAAELWATHGYHGTGVEELSQAVGLRRGALYHHIGSKEALLHEIGRGAIERLLASTEDNPTLDPSERLRRLSRALMRDIAAHQAEWTVFFREVQWLTGERRNEIFAMRGRYEAIWAAVLEATGPTTKGA
jgi:AcrR family transcriptional regulator